MTEEARQHWVLMGNDYPAGILYGTEAEAEAERKRHGEAYDVKRRREQGQNARLPTIYWRVYPFDVKNLGQGGAP